MPTYQFYGETEAGHRTVGREFDCLNLQEAMNLATNMLRDYVTVEVWLDRLLIGVVTSATISASVAESS